MSIAIKGLRQGILIVFDGNNGTPWLSQFFELERKLEANPNFFKGGKIALDVKDIMLNAEDVARAREMLTRYDVALWAILSDNPATQAHTRHAGLLDVLVEPPKPQSVSEDTRERLSEERERETGSFEAVNADGFVMEGSDGLCLRRRVRSGQVIRHPGHIVIIGDVNPGAQVIAGGDIVVWGKLQGNAHAGALGDTKSVICALELTPTLIKIADATRTNRAEKKKIIKTANKPQMAVLKSQEITVEEWK